MWSKSVDQACLALRSNSYLSTRRLAACITRERGQQRLPGQLYTESSTERSARNQPQQWLTAVPHSTAILRQNSSSDQHLTLIDILHQAVIHHKQHWSQSSDKAEYAVYRIWTQLSPARSEGQLTRPMCDPLETHPLRCCRRGVLRSRSRGKPPARLPCGMILACTFFNQADGYRTQCW